MLCKYIPGDKSIPVGHIQGERRTYPLSSLKQIFYNDQPIRDSACNNFEAMISTSPLENLFIYIPCETLLNMISANKLENLRLLGLMCVLSL